MAKEVHKSNFPKCETMVQEFLERLSTDWPKIIGQGTNLIFSKYDITPFHKFEEMVHEQVIFLEYEVSGEHSGKLHLMFSSRDAIIIGGSILMEDEDEIKNNISKNNITEDHIDGFNEFANQTAASFETIYRNHFPDEEDNHIRFTQSHQPPYTTESLMEIFSVYDKEDELLVVDNQCSIWTFEKGDVRLLITVDVCESFFNETVSMSSKKSYAHILVVDSIKKDVSFVKKTLRNSGLFVHICSDSDTAIAKLQHEKIDLVLIDANFGEEPTEEEGLSLCLRIKRNMLLDAIPIIMTAANATKKLVLDCVRIGAADFLVKPYNKDLILFKFEKQVKRKKLAK